MDSFGRDGLTFDVIDGGPPDGEPVILLHGFPQDATAWEEFAPALHREGLRTLAPHQRGYSPLARPNGRRRYTLRETTADVLALMDAAGLTSAHVVGHDLGGLVGWALAAWHPERVRTLTALSTPHPAAMLTPGQALRSYYMAVFQLPALPERLLLAGGGAPMYRMLRGGGVSREAAARYVTRLRQPGALSAALAWYRALPFGVRDRVGPAKVPTLHVWSTGDAYLGRAATAGTARYVDAPYRLEVLDGVTHWLPEVAAARLGKLVVGHVSSGD